MVLQYVLIGVLLLAAAPYLLLPLLILASMAMSVEPQFRETPLELLPASTSEFIGKEIPRIEALGFRLCAILSFPTAG